MMKTELSAQTLNSLISLTAQVVSELDTMLQSQHSISVVQYQLLVLLQVSSQGLNQQSLASQLAIDKSTASRNLSYLSKKGLVSRRHTLSGRDLLVKITNRGTNKLQQSQQCVDQLSHKLFGKFSVYEQKQLSIWLKTLQLSLSNQHP